MPMSEDFFNRLNPLLKDLVQKYGTPFHIYDEKGIVASYRNLVRSFQGITFRQFFAVKALPNPAILKLLHREGSGMDCASATELELVKRVGINGESIVFTGNNTSSLARERAASTGAWITFDDITLLDNYQQVPKCVAFRVALKVGANRLMGGDKTKFGVPSEMIFDAYKLAAERGAQRYGIHQMSCANTLNVDSMLEGAFSLIELAVEISRRVGISFDYINLGGGLGIPYRPEEAAFDIKRYSEKIIECLTSNFKSPPTVFMECGRSITGPHGVLVSQVQSLCQKNCPIIGLDASMSALMRPALYKDSYHHITLPYAISDQFEEYDVVGSLCENIDKFAISRKLPIPKIQDIVLIHDTGAHGHSMGFNYNGLLRPAELLLKCDGQVKMIRRHENFDDYISTVID